MPVVRALKQRGGIARSLDLKRSGITETLIALAVASGAVDRPRRGWLSLPGADPELVSAVRQGVVLTCVTQAIRLGLWTMPFATRHVAGTTTARVDATESVVHWGRPVMPRPPGTLVDPIENVLHYVASCQPFEHALVVWESALNRRLLDRQALERLPLKGRGLDLLDASRPFSDSGLETIAASRLRWLRIRLTPQAHLFGRRVDLLIGDRLVLQIDGATHTGAQRSDDIAFDALLKMRGYHVIRAGYAQVMYEWQLVQSAIMEAVAQGLHLAQPRLR